MTTDQRTGFRLPWAADRDASAPSDEPPAEPSPDEVVTPVADADGTVGADAAAETGTSVAPSGDGERASIDQEGAADSATGGAPQKGIDWPAEDRAGATTSSPTSVRATAAGAAPGAEHGRERTGGNKARGAAAQAADPVGAAPVAGQTGPKPTRFMAELSRAMQAAAEASRDESLARLAAEAKQRIEEIQELGSTGTTELRRRADDDVAATREWSKAEIARIREETERRITERKARLESDVEHHGGMVRRRIELVREAVARHETELAAFIEQLMNEGDPGRIATLAQDMPEPPILAEIHVDEDEDAAAAMAGGPGRASTDGPLDPADIKLDSAAAATTSAMLHEEPVAPADGAAADTVTADDAGIAPEPRAGDGSEPGGGDSAAHEPAVSLSADFAAAAEAEALAGLESGDGAADAWFNGDTGGPRSGAGADAAARTEIIVKGLTSVAGIAGFKRELSRLAGVHAVGVSAGHAGEFVFAVAHDQDADLGVAIPSITAFEAQVHDQLQGALLVSTTEPTAGE